MILDTSAVIAIVFKEPGFEQLLGVLGKSRAVGSARPHSPKLESLFLLVSRPTPPRYSLGSCRSSTSHRYRSARDIGGRPWKPNVALARGVIRPG